MAWFSLVLVSLVALVATMTNALPPSPRSPKFLIPNPPDQVTNPWGHKLVTGCDGGGSANGAVPIRREISDLQDHYPDAWNLYLLGLRSLQMVDQHNPWSYYQIAGIHGRPYVEWQGAHATPSGKGKGYCPHQNTLFFGWHRAYLALYEQELYKHVQNISVQFPASMRSRYVNAAQDFRIPYWDWGLGLGKSIVPDAFIQPTISVIGVNGQAQVIENPLHHYRFHPTYQEDFDVEWCEHNTTLRWPDTPYPSAQSRNDLFVYDYNSRIVWTRETLARCFGQATSFNTFSLDHLESLHGEIHYSVGGAGAQNNPAYPADGHMWPLEYSAFEPVFMLHHCNVDRLFSLYMDTHPDQYMGPRNIGNTGTFAVPDYTVVDNKTGLAPFWKTNSSFWTTADVRNSTVLGYAYPETQYWKYPSLDAYRRALNSTIAALYSSVARSRLSGPSGTGTGGDLTHLNEGGYFNDWSVQIRAQRSFFPPAFIVKFSIVGDFSSDPVSQVGSWSVLMPKEMDMSLLKRDEHDLLNGTVGLTAALLDDVASRKIDSLDPDQVVPYLKEKLSWRVYGGDGVAIPNKNLEGLILEVVSTRVQLTADLDVPLDYTGPRTVYPEVTAGKGGGVKV